MRFLSSTEELRGRDLAGVIRAWLARHHCSGGEILYLAKPIEGCILVMDLTVNPMYGLMEKRVDIKRELTFALLRHDCMWEYSSRGGVLYICDRGLQREYFFPLWVADEKPLSHSMYRNLLAATNPRGWRAPHELVARRFVQEGSFIPTSLGRKVLSLGARWDRDVRLIKAYRAQHKHLLEVQSEQKPDVVHSEWLHGDGD